MELWNVLFWSALTVLLIAVEISTVQLVAVWFAAGSLAAFVSSLFAVPFYAQVIIFILGSVFLLLVTRPIVRRLLRGTHTRTNADSVIGQECVVKEQIDNRASAGRVKVNGLFWTARSEDSSIVIPVDTVCIITEIQGVKLIVKPLEEKKE